MIPVSDTAVPLRRMEVSRPADASALIRSDAPSDPWIVNVMSPLVALVTPAVIVPVHGRQAALERLTRVPGSDGKRRGERRGADHRQAVAREAQLGLAEGVGDRARQLDQRAAGGGEHPVGELHGQAAGVVADGQQRRRPKPARFGGHDASDGHLASDGDLPGQADRQRRGGGRGRTGVGVAVGPGSVGAGVALGIGVGVAVGAGVGARGRGGGCGRGGGRAGRSDHQLTREHRVQPVPGGAGPAAVALAERSDGRDQVARLDDLSGKRIGTHDDPRRPGSVVDEQAEAIRERRGRLGHRARQLEAKPLVRLASLAGHHRHRRRKVARTEDLNVREGDPQDSLGIPAVDRAGSADPGPGGEERRRGRVEVHADAAGLVLEEAATGTVDRPEGERHGALDQHAGIRPPAAVHPRSGAPAPTVGRGRRLGASASASASATVGSSVGVGVGVGVGTAVGAGVGDGAAVGVGVGVGRGLRSRLPRQPLGHRRRVEHEVRSIVVRVDGSLDGLARPAERARRRPRRTRSRRRPSQRRRAAYHPSDAGRSPRPSRPDRRCTSRPRRSRGRRARWQGARAAPAAPSGTSSTTPFASPLPPSS